MLVENDLLRMALTGVCLSSITLRLRMGPDQYEEAPISEAFKTQLVSMMPPFPVASYVATEEMDPEAFIDAVQQHFTKVQIWKSSQSSQSVKSLKAATLATVSAPGRGCLHNRGLLVAQALLDLTAKLVRQAGYLAP